MLDFQRRRRGRLTQRQSKDRYYRRISKDFSARIIGTICRRGYPWMFTRLESPWYSDGNAPACMFSNDPMILHEQAIKRIVKYLMETADRGIVYKPGATKVIEFFIDADFSGGWNQLDDKNYENMMSHTGYVINYAGWPVLLCSKIKTEIALSTTESTYIALTWYHLCFYCGSLV